MAIERYQVACREDESRKRRRENRKAGRTQAARALKSSRAIARRSSLAVAYALVDQPDEPIIIRSRVCGDSAVLRQAARAVLWQVAFAVALL